MTPNNKENQFSNDGAVILAYLWSVGDFQISKIEKLQCSRKMAKTDP